MNRKPSAWESISEFISGKGFYLVVLLCVAVIGVSGYFLVRSVADADGELSEAVVGNTQMPDASAHVQVSATPRPSQTPAVSATGAPTATSVPTAAPTPSATPTPAPSAAPSETPEPSRKPAALVFTRPVNGPVIAAFSAETLLYDETMLDWRTHDGLDLAAEEGTRVLATAAGTVRERYDDDLMGTTLAIDHGKGLVSVYSNLAEDVKVEVGDEVYTGDVIGAVGSTAVAESGRDSHLHFAMYKDDEPVNPEEYLPD